MSWGFGAFSGVPYKTTALHNNSVFANYWLRYSMAGMNMYEWEGLPPTCNAEFLEECLFYTGQAIIVDHPTLGFLNLKCIVTKKNFYNQPVEFECFGSNGNIQMNANIDNSVFIKNNKMRISTAWIIDDYCTRLFEIQATIDINMHAQKTPILILCKNEKDKHTLQNIYRQYEGNRPVIYADKGRGIDEVVTVLQTNAPYVIDKLYTYKQQIEHELMTIMGIKNNEIMDKKERVTLDEVNANNEITNISGDIFYTYRKEAAQKISKFTGENTSVRYRISEREDEYYGTEKGEENEI